jgi:hypothetical protein
MSIFPIFGCVVFLIFYLSVLFLSFACSLTFVIPVCSIKSGSLKGVL